MSSETSPEPVDLRRVLRDHVLRRRLISHVVRGELALPGVAPALATTLLRGLVLDEEQP